MEQIPACKTSGRNSLTACLLSVAATGLGHIYCGQVVKGLILFFASFAFGPIIVAAANRAASALMLAIVIGSLILMLAIFVYAVIDSGLLARKLKTYRLKEYNRWYFYLLLIIVAAGYPTNFAHSIRAHVLEAFKVPTVSMMPGILPGDHILLNKAVYRTQAPQRGDVVIFTYPDDRRLNYVKRIVALPGDTVEIRENVLFVNDRQLDGPMDPAAGSGFKSEGTQSILREQNSAAKYSIIVDSAKPQNMAKITVPHGHCFLLGDNRSRSIDSRNFGPVLMADVKGRLDYIYWPAKSWSRLGHYSQK